MVTESTPADGIAAVLLDTWRIYERHDRMEDAAIEAGINLSTFKRRLHMLYRALGVGSSQQAGRVLREWGII